MRLVRMEQDYFFSTLVQGRTTGRMVIAFRGLEALIANATPPIRVEWSLRCSEFEPQRRVDLISAEAT